MKISIIMAACNQGQFLEKTINSAVTLGLQGCSDWEILVIDDHSTDGCCDRVKQTDRIKVVPKKKLGVSHARHLAGEMVTGDVVMTTDTHCLYPRKSIWRLAQHWAMQNRAVIVPTIKMVQANGSQPVIYGKLTVSKRGLRIDRPRKKPEIPCMFGGTYLMRRDVWDWLGGWLQLPGYWAGEEQVMTTIAYRFGVRILVVDKHVCTHLHYRPHGVYPYELPPTHPAEIAHYIHAACFPRTYEQFWRPIIQQYYNHEMTTDPSSLREWIERRSIRSEKWFLENILNIDSLPKDFDGATLRCRPELRHL